ncbi:RNA polymerase I specific transcription initiation factor RRN3 family protein [Cryptosporidium meleagridis]|uniref:RNA polymerase I specific transcription initiation factor RRN3 family protein n=1 Tax=Cryptosporidium meleagridis TaxID=93969 RepID=A0A2P4Z3E6_9CRYT|nr:RNA polymerase I specific transcription initiation factor RRN3 family protein [Cryptosporidium meleagridis]
MIQIPEKTQKDSSIYGLIGEFDFLGASDSDFGELVHTIVDQIGGENTNNEKLFDVLKKKLTILDNGTLNLFFSSKSLKPDIKDIVLPDGSYFDCKSSLKKELKSICQNAQIDSQIFHSKDLSILKFVFSYHKFFNSQNETRYPQDYDFYVIRHPNTDFNGCRTFAIKKKHGKPSEQDESDNEQQLIPISYVSSVENITSKWEKAGRRIINLMQAIVNIVPSDIKLFITTIQDIYPIAFRNSLDSYILYSKLLFHGIKLIPSTMSILLRFLINKLISLESEVHSKNPNNYTKERFEKWRQEELQTVAIKIRKGEYADINSAKSYIQDLDGLKAQFSQRFTEEDIDRNAQVIDNVMKELFYFISEVYENGFQYTKIFVNSTETSYSTPSKILKVPSNVSNILSSSDLESSAVEDIVVSGYGKKEELLYKQFVDLERTILNIFETQILAIESCQFVNYIPIYLVCHCDSWCEKFLQIIFKKLFNPHETLIIRESSVDYIVFFVTNYKIVCNFKFYKPCIKYLMQFLHDFVAHWSIEKSDQNLSSQEILHSNKRSGLKRSFGGNSQKHSHLTLRNLFGLYCHVVFSFCKFFSVITNAILSENIQESSFEDLCFLIESVLNINRGFIPFILCGDLSPIDNIDPNTHRIFLKSVIRLIYNMIFIQKEKLNISKYYGGIKLISELLNSNSNNEAVRVESKLSLDKLWLWHSGKHVNKFRTTNSNLIVDQDISSHISELLKLIEDEIEINSEKEPEPPTQEMDISEKKYGEMESSILPEQSLWEYVWGDVPVSHEELEQELYVTKNKMYKEDLDKQFDYSSEELNGQDEDKELKRGQCSKKPSYSGMSLLDTLLSSDAFKRGEAILHSYQRKYSPSSKKMNKFSRKSRLF